MRAQFFGSPVIVSGGGEQKREFKLVLEGDKEAGMEKLFEQILGPTAAGGPETSDVPAEAVRPTKEKKKPKNIIATHLTIRYPPQLLLFVSAQTRTCSRAVPGCLLTSLTLSSPHIPPPSSLVLCPRRRGHRRGASDGDDEKKINFLEIGARDLAVQLTLLEQVLLPSPLCG
jgi:hypothetical protein